jgi:purine nucleoside phosphorylase
MMHLFGSMSYERVAETATYLLERTAIRPKIAIICGSGLGKRIRGREKGE